MPYMRAKMDSIVMNSIFLKKRVSRVVQQSLLRWRSGALAGPPIRCETMGVTLSQWHAAACSGAKERLAQDMTMRLGPPPRLPDVLDEDEPEALRRRTPVVRGRVDATAIDQVFMCTKSLCWTMETPEVRWLVRVLAVVELWRHGWTLDMESVHVTE